MQLALFSNKAIFRPISAHSFTFLWMQGFWISELRQAGSTAWPPRESSSNTNGYFHVEDTKNIVNVWKNLWHGPPTIETHCNCHAECTGLLLDRSRVPPDVWRVTKDPPIGTYLGNTLNFESSNLFTTKNYKADFCFIFKNIWHYEADCHWQKKRMWSSTLFKTLDWEARCQQARRCEQRDNTIPA
jgi:hypothetical protein